MFSTGIERAIEVALEAHEGQTRKDGGRYAVHPIHVAMMLARLGLGERVIQAALLHDVVEDCEEWTIQRVAERFGDEVASLVAELTEDKSRSWEERKQTAVDRVPSMSPEARLVKAADKLHNLECLVRELRRSEDREALWSRFNGGRERTLAMSGALVDALAPEVPEALGDALRRAYHELLEVA